MTLCKTLSKAAPGAWDLKAWLTAHITLDLGNQHHIEIWSANSQEGCGAYRQP